MLNLKTANFSYLYPMEMIYLDNNATTKIDPQVMDAIIPYLQEYYGNASSMQHALGRKSHEAVENAREQIANALHVHSKEVFFTSGATEAINTVIKGVFDRYQTKGKHIITAKTEHKAVLSVYHQLEKKGAEISYLSTNSEGQISIDELASTIRKDTILVTLMAANNETGLLHPFEEIAMLCSKEDVLFFCDVTQLIGKATLDLSRIPIDMLCLSGHKFYGPKGVGALYIRRKSKPIQLESLIIGGNQEHGFRAGTYPVHQLVGLGKAMEIAQEINDISGIRDYFEDKITSLIPDTYIYCKHQYRINNTSNIHFRHVRSSELIANVPLLAIASGSACVSGDRNPSHVIKAMGYSDEDAYCSVRFSLSKWTTIEELDLAVEMIVKACEKIRSQSPIWQLYQSGLLD